MSEINLKQIRKHILEENEFVVNSLGLSEKVTFHKNPITNSYYIHLDFANILRVVKITHKKIYWAKWIFDKEVMGNIDFSNCSIPETTEPCQKKS